MKTIPGFQTFTRIKLLVCINCLLFQFKEKNYSLFVFHTNLIINQKTHYFL